MEQLLTDDELVAAASLTSTSWPLPLLTVDTADGPALTAAALRGLRSLVVRGLLSTVDDNRSLSAPVGDAMRAVSNAESVVVAHASETARIGYHGAAVAAFSGQGFTLTDTATVDGIHALSTGTTAKARSTILRFARAMFDASQTGDGATCVIVAASSSGQVLRIAPSSVEVGSIVQESGHGSVFLPAGEATEGFGTAEEFLDGALASFDDVEETVP